MSCASYHADTDHFTAVKGWSGDSAGGSGRGTGADPVGVGLAVAGDDQVEALAVPCGVAPGARGFQEGIEAGQRVLGNRACPALAAGTGRSGHSVAGWGRPDTGVPGVVGTAGTGASGAAPGQAGAGPAGLAGMTPAKKIIGGGQVQAALRVLKDKGVEAFGNYIEAEIRYTLKFSPKRTFLNTLVERLNNDRDLEDVRSKALALVQACLQARSNRSADRRAGVNAPAPGQVPGLVSSRPHELGIADTAQVSQLVSQWEKDLFGACISGDTGQASSLLGYTHIDANMADASGTLLCHAAYGGHERIVDALLMRPDVDVNLAGTTERHPAVSGCRGRACSGGGNAVGQAWY